jgi:hypothetical protein
MSDRLTTVATFHEPVAAALARNFLESEGIPAVLFDETTIATDWMLAGAIGGIKLQVAPIHLERAELLLSQIQDDREEAEVDEPMTTQTAIASREIAEELQAEREDRAPINQLVDRLFRCAIFGLILWPLQLYTLYLLLQLAGTQEKASPDRKWKIWVSMLVNVPLMSVIVVPLLCLLDRFSRR